MVEYSYGGTFLELYTKRRSFIQNSRKQTIEIWGWRELSYKDIIRRKVTSSFINRKSKIHAKYWKKWGEGAQF